ncbi:hypothetical protein [Paraburkholderia agricolaris]|uniref:hypothetical protein n=1 Tax=Paraburkholderia agricolaris TaxID=2152888 RepID=UPI00129204C8|nr:hypothetical protein [Paraburkholderia agricolaris]
MDGNKNDEYEAKLRDSVMAIVGFALGAVLAAAFTHMPGDSSAWASWAQTIGTVGTIAVALIVARRQIMAERAARTEATNTEAATVILSLQVMANELARMCTLSMFQKQDKSGRIIYADAAGEFDALASMFRDFPIDVVASQGKVGDLLQLRRIALEMAGILRSDPDLGGEQFVARHRTRNRELTKSARRISIALANLVEEICPGKFTSRIVSHM